jgi:hypothetical protein
VIVQALPREVIDDGQAFDATTAGQGIHLPSATGSRLGAKGSALRA